MKTYFRILKFVKPYWKHLTLSVFFTILYALLNGASIYMTIPLLDTLFMSSGNSAGNKTELVTAKTVSKTSVVPGFLDTEITKAKRAFSDFIFQGSTNDILLKICSLVLLAFLGKNVFGYLQAYYLAFVEQGVVRDLRNTTYVHLQSLPMSFFKNEKTGNLISRLTNDVNVVQGSVSAVFLNMIREPLTICVFLGMALSISWRLTMFSFLVLPFSLAIISYIGLKLRKQSAILQANMSSITTTLHETISGVKIVKAFTMEKYEEDKFKRQTQGFFRLSLKMARMRNASSPITEFLSTFVGAVIIYYGGNLVLSQHGLKASEFLGFLFAIFQLMPPVKELSGVNNRIQESNAAADRIFEILDRVPDIKDAPQASSIGEFKNEISFEHVGFSYNDNPDPILKDISFKVKKGEIVAFVGSSGAGKTTLVDLIPRFFDPTEGAIRIDGQDIRELKIRDLRRLMGIVTQETVLFNESAGNNIAYGLDSCPLDKIIEASKAANAHQFISELHLGYDSIVGEKGTKLSGGQRQRISIARAILKNPPIMILDEATSALDNESEVLVQEAIERLMKDRTTFVIAHRLSTIRNADRIIVLDHGRIVQQGRHQELIKDESGVYHKLYSLQFKA